MDSNKYILNLSCPDAIGIVAKVTETIARNHGNIVDAKQYTELQTNMFFMRVVIDKAPSFADNKKFEDEFSRLARSLSMKWSFDDAALKKKVVVLVSKQQHCLCDLLYRWRIGELRVDIVAVISNHEHLREYVEWHGISYFCTPIRRDHRNQDFHKVNTLLHQLDFELLILARYMQILPPDIVAAYFGRIMNIHHGSYPPLKEKSPTSKLLIMVSNS